MPSQAMIHYDEFLSSFGIAAFETPQKNHVFRNIFPTIPVARQSDKYRVWDDEDFLRDDFEVLPLNTESAGTDVKWSDSTYYAKRRALHVDIDDAERSNTDADIDLETAAVSVLAAKAQLHLERAAITALMTTGVWGTDLTGNATGTPGTASPDQWNDIVNSDPVLDVFFASDTVLNATGLAANTAVVSQNVWRALMVHPKITSRFQYVRDYSDVSEDMVAAVLGLEKLYVSRSIRVTNIEGATKAKAVNLGKVAWVGYVPDNIGPMTPTPAAFFAWDGVGGMPGISDLVPIQKFRMDEIHSDRIEGMLAFDVKVTAPSLGVFMSSIIA